MLKIKNVSYRLLLVDKINTPLSSTELNNRTWTEWVASYLRALGSKYKKAVEFKENSNRIQSTTEPTVSLPLFSSSGMPWPELSTFQNPEMSTVVKRKKGLGETFWF